MNILQVLGQETVEGLTLQHNLLHALYYEEYIHGTIKKTQ